MKKVFILLFFTIFLIGCSSKENFLHKTGVEEQALVNSKTIQLKEGKVIKAFVVVTYLNQVEEKYRKDNLEKFIVGIYAPQKYNQILSKLKIYVGKEKEAGTMQKLANNDERLKLLSSSNVWNTYYLVTAPKVVAKTVTLFFEGDFSPASVIFSKKYF
jgi:hypothetical protein